VRFFLSDLLDERRCFLLWHPAAGWLTGCRLGVDGVHRDQILRLLGEREAAGRAEMLRLEQEAAGIAGLIEECRREVERLAITREVVPAENVIRAGQAA
jgi:hypothetical protein